AQPIEHGPAGHHRQDHQRRPRHHGGRDGRGRGAGGGHVAGTVGEPAGSVNPAADWRSRRPRSSLAAQSRQGFQMSEDGVLIGQAEAAQFLRLDRANRHGLVAGATGTGKTVTLQILAQGLSDAGVPVFAADVKGDLSGVSQPGQPNEKFLARATSMNLELRPEAAPTIFWDLFGEQGHPIRASVSEMGPLLLSRMLELNDVQEGVLSVVFRAADDEGLLLLDLKDLQAALTWT